MDLINKICCDLSFERIPIIRKYLLPEILNEKTFDNVYISLLSDLFNCLEKEEVITLREPIEDLVGEFDIDEFLETEWKIGVCNKCKTVKSVLKCKHEHEEECEYCEITSPEGCQKYFCEDCVFHICESPCKAIRCEECSEI